MKQEKGKYDYYSNKTYKRGIAKQMAYTYLANAISHMDDASDLDLRTHIITCRIFALSEINQMKFKIGREIRKAIYGKSKPKRHQKIGLIIAGDINNSRFKSPILDEAGQAHIHTILILTKEQQENTDINKLYHRLEFALINLPGVQYVTQRRTWTEQTYPVDIRQVIPDKSYWQVIDYFVKCEKYVDADKNTSPYVWPIDGFRHRKKTSSRKTKKLEILGLWISGLRDNLIFDPRNFFQFPPNWELSVEHKSLLTEYDLLPTPDEQRIFRNENIGKVTYTYSSEYLENYLDLNITQLVNQKICYRTQFPDTDKSEITYAGHKDLNIKL